MVDKKHKIKPMENDWRSPPTWCASICTYALSQECLEGCAIRRDCSWFEPKKEITELPLFPLMDFLNTMTAMERMAVVGLHLLYLEGGLNNGREISYNSRSSQDTQAFQIHRLCHGSETADPLCEDHGEARIDQGIRPAEVGRK